MNRFPFSVNWRWRWWCGRLYTEHRVSGDEVSRVGYGSRPWRVVLGRKRQVERLVPRRHSSLLRTRLLRLRGNRSVLSRCFTHSFSSVLLWCRWLPQTNIGTFSFLLRILQCGLVFPVPRVELEHSRMFDPLPARPDSNFQFCRRVYSFSPVSFGVQ